MTNENQQTQDDTQREEATHSSEENESIEEQKQAQSEGGAEQEIVEDLEQNDAVEQLEREKEEYKSRFLRVQADFENFRRRKKEEKTADAKYRSQSLAEKLIPALDNFERALNVQPEGSEAQSILEGMDMVYRQIKDAFEAENIREIPAEGEPFDPQFHQAVMQVDHDDYESNTVVEVMQKGYKLNDRVIRPSMVKVAN